MDPKTIGEAYDQIAERWQSDNFNASNGIAQHQRALAFLRPLDEEGAYQSPLRRALDVGCGCNGRFIDLLQDQGFAVEGIDVSAEMIRLARLRNPDAHFVQGDIVEWQPQHRYDFVTAWDSIWHVPLAAQEAVLGKLLDALHPGGVCIFTSGGVDEPDQHTDDVMGPEVGYSALGIPRLLEIIAASGCICRHLEYDQYPELHLTLIVQRR